MEKLGIVILIFALFGIAQRLQRAYQRARARECFSAPAGRVSLLLIVSPHCSACPAQKRVVARLTEHYPPTLLHVETLNVEAEPEQARKLGVMTVPSTLIRSPQGTVVHINNGFATFAKLEKQVGGLTGAAV